MCCEGSRQRAPLVERESLAATSLLHQRPREPPAASFDHLVGAKQNGSWNGDANCFGSPHVDNKLETARSLDGQIRGLRIAQKLACHRADRAIRVEKIRPIRHQSPRSCEVREQSDRRKSVVQRQIGKEVRMCEDSTRTAPTPSRAAARNASLNSVVV